MEHKIISSLSEIDKGEWDSFVDDPSLLWGWIYSIESIDIDIVPKHILVYENENLVGIMPHFIQKDDIFYSMNKRFYPYIHHIIQYTPLSLTPISICYSPGSFVSKIMVKDDNLRKQVYDYILKIIEKEKIFKKSKYFCFPYVEGDTELMDSMTANGFFKFRFETNTFIELDKFNSFDDYLKHLKKNKNLRLTKEFKVMNDDGVKIEYTSNISGHEERLSELYYETYSQYVKSKKNPFTPELFKNLQDNLGENLLFILAKKDDEIIGFDMCIIKDNVLLSFKVGLDKEKTKDNCVYFHLCYYETVRYAIENGLRKVISGPSSYTTKIKRGFNVSELDLFIKSNNGFNNYYIKKLLGYQQKKFADEIEKNYKLYNRTRTKWKW